jgi:hypothetical protein
MPEPETESGTTRDDLLQRVALMETMIAEGRRSTARFGWIFLMWGLLYFAAIGWEMFLPAAKFAWPVCIILGIVTVRVWKLRQRRSGLGDQNPRSRSISAVWAAMGIAISLYVGSAALSHHIAQPEVNAAVLFFLGLAHAASAMILRWRVQGAVAAIWWSGGIAVFFAPASASVVIFLIATFFGMILFGAYAMMLERRRSSGLVEHHA